MRESPPPFRFCLVPALVDGSLRNREYLMQVTRLLLGFGLLVGVLGATPPLAAADMPTYMDVIVAGEPPAPAETARQNVLALNAAMFGLYDESGRIFKKNLLGQHPVILALFNGSGGRFILYKPGAAPIEAPSVPVVYQLLKSVGHATMVIAVMGGRMSRSRRTHQ